MPLEQDVPPGAIQFYDNGLPLLEAGEYQINVTHTLADDAGQPIGRGPLTAAQRFTVDAPRFALDSTEVYAFYPPDGARGDFAQTLPHVILKRRTLPWERLLGEGAEGAGGDYQPPWLALLLFDEQDAGAEGGWQAKTLPVSQVLSPEAGVLGPKLGTLPAYQQGANCLALDVPAALFESIAPALDELAYLAHVRQVNTADKELSGAEADGWFSVVFCNRLPNPSARNTAHLVSLEGFGGYLPDSSGAGGGAGGYETVRLVSLASWSFSCDESRGSFRELMAHLSEGAAALALPGGTSEAATEAEGLVAAALAQGYVPLNHSTPEGEQTVSWYRGPLTPVLTERFYSQDPYLTADEAKVYDPATGMFDISYAAAWQMGRLLALADANFATALMNWRRKGYGVVDMLGERLRLFGDEVAAAAPGPAPVVASAAMEAQTARGRFADYLKNRLAPQAVPAEGGARPLIRVADPTGLAGRAGRIPGLLGREGIRAHALAGRDPAAAVAEALSGVRADEGATRGPEGEGG